MESLEAIRAKNAPKAFDSFNAVMIIESGNASDSELIKAFQCLIDCGLVWQLQGWYGRTAEHLINAGFCHAKNN